MIHGEETVSGSTFTESSPVAKTVTKYGNAVQSTAQYKFGSKSWYFDGSGSYLSLPDSSDFDFGTGSFTLDFWYYPLSNPVAGGYLVIGDGEYWDINNIAIRNANTYIGAIVGDGSTSKLIVAPSNPSVSNWHHVALVWDKTGNTMYFFIDGSSQGTLGISGSSVYNTASGLSIGRYGQAGGTFYYANAYIDEVRVSKGVARWTSGFSVPTSPYG